MSEEQVEQTVECSSSQQEEKDESSPLEIEKLEEAKLKAKYSLVPGGPAKVGGHSAFLQKRLAKGQKFFDSGDYQMAKQKKGGIIAGGINKPPMKVSGPIFPTGEAIPTPETVPTRKTSIVQPSKLSVTTPTSSLGSNIA